MLYWIEVYALVIGTLMAPFALLYGVVVLSGLGATAMRLMIRKMKRVWSFCSTLLRHHTPPMNPA